MQQFDDASHDGHLVIIIGIGEFGEMFAVWQLEVSHRHQLSFGMSGTQYFGRRLSRWWWGVTFRGVLCTFFKAKENIECLILFFQQIGDFTVVKPKVNIWPFLHTESNKIHNGQNTQNIAKVPVNPVLDWFVGSVSLIQDWIILLICRDEEDCREALKRFV